MSDNPLDRIPTHDRVSIRAVVVPDGVDPGPALARAGITDPLTLPMRFGEGPPDRNFGDGFTPNVIAVLEYATQGASASGTGHGEDGARDPALIRRDGGARADPLPGDTGGLLAEPPTINVPAEYGMQPLAPVRRAGRGGRPGRATPPRPEE